MASIPQLQRGFVGFVDNEVAVAFTGWQKAVVAGGAALLAANLPKIISAYPVVAAIGVLDPATGDVDVDALYNAFVPKLGADKVPIVIPKIGTIKMGREEFDRLMQYVKEA
jgi:hypothetical protein